MTFAALVLFAALIGSIIVTVRLAQGFCLSVGGRLVLFGSVFAMWLTPVFIINRPQVATGMGYAFVVDGLYFIFILAVLTAFFIVLRDILWFCLWQTARFFKRKFPSPFQNGEIKKANAVLLILIFITAGFALYAGKKVPDVKTVSFISEKIPSPVTIAVLSDLHLTRNLSQKKLSDIVHRTLAQRPDLIVLPGDTIDDLPRFIKPHLDILARLQAPLGVYATAGNHEFYVGYQQAVQALRDTGIIYLNNNGIPVGEQLFMAGIPDIGAGARVGLNADVSKALSGKGNRFTVLLSHQPKIAATLDATQTDLQISGHTHGGQIFPFHIIAKIVNTYLSGAYLVNGFNLYVSNGSGQWGPQMRLFAPSEITLIRLIPAKDQQS